MNSAEKNAVFSNNWVCQKCSRITMYSSHCESFKIGWLV